MANEVELVAITSIASVHIPLVPWDAIHFCLYQWCRLEVLAVRAATTTGLFLVNLHGFAERHPVGLVCAWLVGWLLRAEHPVVDHHLGVLLVLGRCDERHGFRQAGEASHHDLWHFHCGLLK